jgi:hypothetical protein
VHLGSVANDALAQRQLEIARHIGKPLIDLSGVPAADAIPAVIEMIQTRLKADSNPAVYFIYDHYSDGARVSSLTELIGLRTGCEVFLPEAGEKYHKFRLQVSDGVLLFRADAPEDWLESQEQTLLQAAARRDRRHVPEAKYIARRADGEPLSVRTRQGTRDEWIIERIGEPNVDDLAPFVDALRTSVKSSGRQPP